MSEDNVYKDGDIVWVKLGNNWWPGEVTDVHRQPEGLIQNLKRKPYCVVKFFQEDAYEYVKSAKQIFPFQCQKKEEFIKKGLALYNAKNKFMEKFPSDVKVAESLTSKSQQAVIASPVDTLVINKRPDSMVKAILGQTTVRDNYNDNSFARRAINGNPRRESITILNITSHRGTNTSYSPNNAQYDKTPNSKTLLTATTTTTTPTSSKFTPPLSRLAAYNSNVYSCNLCNFTSTRQNVMIFHRKTHSTPTPISKININTTKTTDTTTTTTTVIVTSTATATTSNKKPITITTTKTTNVTPIQAATTTTTTTNTTTADTTTIIPAISKCSSLESTTTTITTTTPPTTPLSTITRTDAADAGGIVNDATKQTSEAVAATATVVATKQHSRGRGRRQRRTSKQTNKITAITSTTTTITSEDEILSCDDVSSIRTDGTALSPTNTNNTTSNGSVSQMTNRTVETITTTPTTSISKGNSEELRQRLLADWSDEDNMDEHERTVKDKTVKSKIMTLTKDEDTHANNPKMATSQACNAVVVVVNDDNNSSNSNSASSNNKVDKSLTRIRNIPKKDRRDVILTEFNSERNKIENKRTSTDAAAAAVEIDTTPTTSKPDANEIQQLVIETQKTTATTLTTNDAAPATKMSCFDFREDDDEEQTPNDALNSIANFKKKLLCTADKVTSTVKDSKQDEDEELIKKDNELSVEIENLLQQTHTTVSDVNAFQNVTNTKHISKKDDVTASVKGLPIKERGKRIFKSRNHARENCEPLLAATQLEEEQKIPAIEDKEEEEALTNVEQQACAAVAANGEEKLEQEQEEEEAIIPVVKHAPMEIYRSVSVEEVNDENSSISEADAVFGSPTSMLDDDRLPLIKENAELKKIEDKETLAEDEEEIESPPHEELSGNELEAEIQRARKRTLTKTQRTPTPKKQILKQQQKTEDNNTNAKETDSNNIAQETITTLTRKRRAHMKVTACRRNSENKTENILNDAQLEQNKQEETQKDHMELNKLEDENMQAKRHKKSEKEPNKNEEKIKQQCKVLLRKIKIPLNAVKVAINVPDDVKHAIEKQEQEPKTNANISKQDAEALLNNEDVQLCLDNDKVAVANKKELIEDLETKETADLIETQKLQNSKKSNNNNQTYSLSVKSENESKIVTTNGNNSKQQLHVNESDEQKSVWNATKMQTMAAAATGGRKHAGHRIGLPKTYKLPNKPEQQLSGRRRRASSKTQQDDEVLSAKLQKTASTYNVTMAQQRKSHTPDILDAAEIPEQQLEQPQENSSKLTLEAHNDEETAMQVEENVDAQKTVTTFKLDETQVVQMQSEEQQMEPPAKILAVPTQPLAGYNETFLLCTLVNNQYKPIDNVPLYLDHDLNQLVPVPIEALEGQPDLIVNPIPADSNNTTNIQQSVVKAILTDAETDVYDEIINEHENNDLDKTNKQVKVMSLPTNVSDMMAEAAAAAVSTVMTPALVHGNQSNLQLTTSVTTTGSTAEAATQPAFMLLPDGAENNVASTALADVGNEIVAGHAIIINIEGQQIIIDPTTFAQLLANPDANTQLITDDGTEFVLTREVLTALEAQHALVQTQSLISDNASNDILAVALAGSDLYGSDMLEIETSQGLQLVCSDGNLGFQTAAHLTPPITAQTSETNALLDQTPIMSTLEAPTSTTMAAVNAAAKLKSHELSPNSAADMLLAADDEIATPNLEDSLAVIGVTTQPSAIPTSLELPITVTNPAIAPKVSLPSMLQVPDALMQFAVQPSVSIITESGAHIYNDAGS